MSIDINDILNYEETAESLMAGKITKETFSFEEMEYCCIKYIQEIKRDKDNLSVEIIEAADESLIIKAGEDVFEIPTIEMFFTMKNLKRNEIESVLMAKTEKDFLNKFYFL